MLGVWRLPITSKFIYKPKKITSSFCGRNMKPLTCLHERQKTQAHIQSYTPHDEKPKSQKIEREIEMPKK
jgi:hypothetical protein